MTVRVLRVLDELRASGAERMILAAAKSWAESGISIVVVATGQEVGPAQPQFVDAGVEVFHAPYRPCPGYVRELAVLARPEADIVQFHTERAFVYCEIACRLAGCTVIHAPRTVISIGGLWRARRIAQRWLARRDGAVMIAASDSVLQNESIHFRNPSHLIRNYIHTDRFAVGDRDLPRIYLGVDPGTLLFCSVGNCLGCKNHTKLKALHQWGVGRHDWLLLDAGHQIVPGEIELPKRLRITQRCRFLGPVAEPEEILSASAVFLLPSLSDGIGKASAQKRSVRPCPCVDPRDGAPRPPRNHRNGNVGRNGREVDWRRNQMGYRCRSGRRTRSRNGATSRHGEYLRRGACDRCALSGNRGKPG